MNEKVINFYLAASKLKEVIRTGWKEVGISSDKIESVADHVYGCMILTLGLMSEKDYSSLNLEKTFKMLIVKELVKAANMEQSILSKEEKKAANREAIVSMTDGLAIQDELVSLYDEAVACETQEAKFVLYVGKLESDIQAKKYELSGEFKLENALEDIQNYPEELRDEILPQVKNASDGWLLFDRKYYDGDETFVSLSKYVQDMK